MYIIKIYLYAKINLNIMLYTFLIIKKKKFLHYIVCETHLPKVI